MNTMKKISLYILSLLAAVIFTACDEDFKDWADPQSNETEPAVSISFQATATSNTIDLATAAESIEIATQTSLAIEEGNTVDYEVYLDKDADFGSKTSYTLTADGSTLFMAQADLQEAITALFGKRPEARDVNIRIDAYVKTPAGQASLARSNTMVIKAIPQAPVIESAYYLIGDMNKWAIGDLEDYKFTHSGKDVYDDPVFTRVIFLEESAYFKIVPESSKVAASWDGVLGNPIDGNDAVEGDLIIADAQAMQILESGLYRITLNMMEYTYKIDRLGDNLPESAYYMIGTMSGWNGSDASTLLQFEHSGKDVVEDPYFTLLFESAGDCYWKVVPQSTVTALNNGEISDMWGGLLATAVNDDPSLSGTLSPTADGAMLIKESGWVKVTLNMMEYSYTVEVIGEMALQLYVPGGHQGWSPEIAPILYTRSFDMKYEGYIYMDAGNGFKIITEPTWDSGTHYGDGGDGTLSFSGGDITVTDAGYYKIDVNLTGATPTYTMTATTWGLIGDATPGAWDNSTEMTYADDKWTVTTTLLAGKEYKFRANNGWDINLGGDLNNLSYGGDNIKVSEEGEYVITLDLSNPKVYKATVVKN